MIEQKNSFIRKQVTMGELLGFLITLVGFCFITYTSFDKRMTIVEQEYIQEKEVRLDIKADLKNLIEGQSKILIELQNKQDRKN